MDTMQIKNNLVTAYQRYALEREQAETQPWKMDLREEFAQTMKAQNLQTLLEIGAGHGRDSLYFQQNGFDVTCTDLTPQMVALCLAKGLNAKEMDFSHLEFADASFDAVWALNCLLHVKKEDLPSVLHEVRRVLRPEGLFFMGVYGGVDSEGVWENDHYEPKRYFSFFTDEALKKVLQEKFTILSFQSFPHNDALTFQAVVLTTKTGA